MNETLNLTLSVLVVDDDFNKTLKIVEILNQCSQSKIIVVKDQISAQQQVLNEKFDLLILDMQLPLRFGEGEPEKDGGEKVLKELEIGDDYFQPLCIIVLTEFDELQQSIRDAFSDIAALKFDLSSSQWEASIKRVVSRLISNKRPNKNIIYCEGGNAFLYNLVDLPKVEFIGLPDSRAVYLAAKNENLKFALRDKDFLTKKEVSSLMSKFSNYYILKYYCFENYLLHPDNIAELMPDFDKENYIQELSRQKKAKLMTIIQDYKLSRNAYSDLNDDNKNLIDKYPEDEIIASLESDVFECFYPFFDMAGKKDSYNKKSFDKTCICSLNLDPRLLVKTHWFKTKIGSILQTIL